MHELIVWLDDFIIVSAICAKGRSKFVIRSRYVNKMGTSLQRMLTKTQSTWHRSAAHAIALYHTICYWQYNTFIAQ